MMEPLSALVWGVSLGYALCDHLNKRKKPSLAERLYSELSNDIARIQMLHICSGGTGQTRMNSRLTLPGREPINLILEMEET